jgi:hypothetical protein
MLTIYSDRLQQVVKDGKPQEALSRLVIFIYYEKQYISFLKALYENPDGIEKQEVSNISKIQWLGTNETELVQFVYGLKEAGIIGNNGEGIEKLVREFAMVLNFKLSNNWHSNHSASIHKSNSDYSPPIFDRIKQAYSDYRIKKIDKSK